METERAAKRPRLEVQALRPVLPEELTTQPELRDSFVAVIKNKKDVSGIIGALSKCLPCPAHLKRCSGLMVYLAPTDAGSAEFLKDKLARGGLDLTLFEDELKVVQVAAVGPRTKAQAAQAAKSWPLNFHPDLRLEALVSGALLEGPRLASLEACMRLAVEAARPASGPRSCNGSALVLDPEANAILALAASSVEQHPMWHAALLAIDLVARLRGGGAWQLAGPGEAHPPLVFPAALRDLALPADLDLAERNREAKLDAGPYLCTGLWIVLLQEPCALCAMALLHSRVARVFYGAPNRSSGVLGSKTLLHSLPGLNHRYQVWSSLLEDECVSALAKCRIVDD